MGGTMKWILCAGLATMLIGCASQQEVAKSRFEHLGQERPTAAPSTKTRHFAIVTGLPIISTSVPGAKQDIVIYVTPSCPTCMRLWYDLVINGIMNSNAFDDANISFVLVPRVDDDHEIIKNIFCVEHKDVFTSVSDYFKSAWEMAASIKKFDGPTMGSLTRRLISVSAATARTFGVPDTALAKCQASREFDRAIVAAWEHGWRRNPKRDWPLIVLNNSATDIKNSAGLLGLVDALKE